MAELDEFRAETRAWLAENCPAGARGPGPIPNGSTKIKIGDRDTLSLARPHGREGLDGAGLAPRSTAAGALPRSTS